MKTTLLAALVPLLAFAGPARKPVIALLPPEAATPELANLGALIEARASALLQASGKYTELHAKQVAAMDSQEGAQEGADAKAAVERARALLGADRAVTLRLVAVEKGLKLEGAVFGADSIKTWAVTTGPLWAEALPQASEALATAVLAQDKGALPKGAKAQPESKSEAALLALGACWSGVVRQSVAIESPATLAGEEVDAAIAACTEAVAADGTLTFARASLALAQAIAGDDAAAVKTLAPLSDANTDLVPYVLARTWLVTRYQSPAAAQGFLAGVVAKQPGQLLYRAYLADLQSATGADAKAITGWNEYLALAPNAAFAHGRLSRALARSGQVDKAVAAAKKGLELAPTSREARLQLASRLIDQKKLEDAATLLKPLAEMKDALPEFSLRLGWAYWLDDDPEAAARLFQSAADHATGPTGWRTRGRALYNLAMVAVKEGRPDAAKAHLKASLETGFKVSKPDASVAALLKEVSATAKAAAPGKVKESSLLPTNAAGEVDPAAVPPAAPKDFVPVRP